MAEEKKKDFQENAEALEPRVYEVGYLLFPTIREEDLNKEQDALLALITNLKGQKISEEDAKLIDLAYSMSNIINNKKEDFSQAFFGWIKFKINPAEIISLERELFKSESVLRFIIIKTLEENTVYSEKPFKFAELLEEKKQKVFKENKKLETVKGELIDKNNDVENKLNKTENIDENKNKEEKPEKSEIEK